MQHRLVSGGIVTLVAQVFRLGLQVVGLVLLSRLLEPSDFGTFAIAAAIVGFGELIRDCGLTLATTQSEVLTQTEASNIFWLNVVAGTLLWGVFSLASNVAGVIFDLPALRSLVPVVSVSLVLMAFQAQFQVNLVRRMKFRALAGTEVLGQTAGLAVGLFFAVRGAGVWSLAIQWLASGGVLLLSRVLSSGWIPSWPARRIDLSRFVRFGGNLMAAHILAFVATRIHAFVIGVRLGADQLGVYDRAQNLLNVPVNQVLAPLTNVALPVLSRVRHAAELQVVILRIQALLCGGGTILLALVASMAEVLVPLLLGPQWNQTVLVFQILCVGGVFSVHSFVSYWMFLASGLTRELLHYNLITKTVTVVLVVAASRWGLEAVALAYSSSLVIALPINVYWLNRVSSFPARQFLVNSGVILLAGTVGSMIVMSRGFWPTSSAIHVLTAAIVSAGLLLIFPTTRRALSGRVGAM